MLALAPNKNAGIVQEHDLPGDLAPGASQLVTWSLDIYDCEGFARFQIQFPDGISAQPVETASASYSFEEGKAKFIWMELPPKNALQVSLEISADSDFTGGSVTQWFSFIRDGRRKDVEFEPHHLARREPSAPSRPSESAELSVEREWTATSKRTGTMTLTVSGHEPGQFLKLTELLGPHDAVSILKDANCDIRDAFDEQLVFIWQAAPRSADVVVQYTMREGNPNKVRGRIATIRDNTAVEQVVGAIASVNDDALAGREKPEPEPVPAPIDGEVAYRIQILATRAQVSSEAVKRIYAYPGEVRHEQHFDWHKYTTGYHTTYRAARDNRVDLSSNHAFPGPFVTAYRNGQRITVQEALLVTKQNWIP